MTGLFDNATVWLSLRTLAYRLWIIGAEEDCRHYVAGESLTVHTELAFFLSSWRLLTVCFLSVCLPGRESTLCCPEALLSLLDNGEGAPSWISSPLIAAPLFFFFLFVPDPHARVATLIQQVSVSIFCMTVWTTWNRTGIILILDCKMTVCQRWKWEHQDLDWWHQGV